MDLTSQLVFSPHGWQVCKGTTLDFSCEQGPPPAASVANVTKAALQFLVGFTEGLGTEVGFAPCIKDIEGTFHDIATIVDFFENSVPVPCSRSSRRQ